MRIRNWMKMTLFPWAIVATLALSALVSVSGATAGGTLAKGRCALEWVQAYIPSDGWDAGDSTNGIPVVTTVRSSYGGVKNFKIHMVRLHTDGPTTPYALNIPADDSDGTAAAQSIPVVGEPTIDSSSWSGLGDDVWDMGGIAYAPAVPSKIVFAMSLSATGQTVGNMPATITALVEACR